MLFVIGTAAQSDIDGESALLKTEIARLGSPPATGSAVETPASAPFEPIVASPVQRSAGPIQWSGDLRYRVETIDDGYASPDHRRALRARARTLIPFVERIDLGFGLVSEGVNDDSGSFTPGNGFSAEPPSLDLAYFDWRISETTHVVGGRMVNPFFRAADNQLLYDGDLRPEGLAVNVRNRALFANASAFRTEDRAAGPDSMWWGLQAGYRPPADIGAISFATGASYYNTTHTQGRPPLFSPSDGHGNQLDADGNYLYGFSQWELFGEVTLAPSRHRFTLFADYVTNTAAGRYSNGLAAGATYRGAAFAPLWQLSYIYQDLQANAVVGAFTDSDFAAGTSDGKGHIIKAMYGRPLGWHLTFRYFRGVRGLATDLPRDHNRIQADLGIAF